MTDAKTYPVTCHLCHKDMIRRGDNLVCPNHPTSILSGAFTPPPPLTGVVAIVCGPGLSSTTLYANGTTETVDKTEEIWDWYGGPCSNYHQDDLATQGEGVPMCACGWEEADHA